MPARGLGITGAGRSSGFVREVSHIAPRLVPRRAAHVSGFKTRQRRTAGFLYRHVGAVLR